MENNTTFTPADYLNTAGTLFNAVAVWVATGKYQPQPIRNAEGLYYNAIQQRKMQNAVAFFIMLVLIGIAYFIYRKNK
tara:strand:- start:87 stop:320 length:234 start_codon:yes stop_codon:yes gene_type:complete